MLNLALFEFIYLHIISIHMYLKSISNVSVTNKSSVITLCPKYVFLQHVCVNKVSINKLLLDLRSYAYFLILYQLFFKLYIIDVKACSLLTDVTQCTAVSCITTACIVGYVNVRMGCTLSVYKDPILEGKRVWIIIGQSWVLAPSKAPFPPCP